MLQISEIPDELVLEQQDDKLWAAFQSGSPQAFEAIYRQHYAHLYSYGWQLCRDTDLLRDAIQNLFVDIWRSKQNLAQVKQVRFYLFKILRRKILATLKEERKKEEVHSELLTYDFLASTYSDEQLELLDKLKEAVSRLSKKQREVIFLRYYENLSCEEIAELMQLNINTVYNHNTAAIRHLRLQFEKNKLILLMSTFPSLFML
ncbi:MAG: RNA polymerase sigma factor [Cyclobacteriaceae bacterium]